MGRYVLTPAVFDRIARAPTRRRRGAAADRRHARPLPDRALPRAGLRRRTLRHRQQAGLAAGHGRGGACSTRSWARASAMSWPRSSAGRASAEPLAGWTATRRRPGPSRRSCQWHGFAPMGPIPGRRRYPPQGDPPRRSPAGGPGGLSAVAGGDGQPARRARPRDGRGRARGRGGPALRQLGRRRLRGPRRRRRDRRRSSCGWTARSPPAPRRPDPSSRAGPSGS